MIRTLRITSIVAGLLAAGLLALFSMYGVQPDPQTVQLLSTPTVIEQFKDRPTVENRADTVSVLEELAKGLARLINPPAAAASVQPQARTGPVIMPTARPRPSAKFKLLATSYHPSDPNLSRALIELDTVDQRQVWVRIGQTIEHYTITDIKDGSIAYGSGDSVQLVQVEPRPPKVNLLAGQEPRPRQMTVSSLTNTPAVSPRPRPQLPPRTVARASNPNLPTATKPQSDQDIQRAEQMVAQLQSMGPQSEDPEKQRIQQEVLEKLGAYIQAARLNNEANGLGQQQDMNLPGIPDPNLIQ